jgi:glycerol-3-phosphate acyltransferase PlsX
VADGFTGNIMLKSVEGTGKFLSQELKKLFLSGTKSKLAALLIRKDMASFKKLLDANEVGGTPFLGISKPVIKAHGSSNARAIRNAIRQARDFAASGFIQDVQDNIAYMKVDADGEKD